MERQSLTTRGYPLVLSCKTFQQLYLIIPRESDIVDIIETIHMFAQPSELIACSMGHGVSQSERVCLVQKNCLPSKRGILDLPA